MNTVLAVALTSHLVPDAPSISPLVWKELRSLPSTDEPEAVSEFAARQLRPAEAEIVAARLADMERYRSSLAELESAGIFALSESDAQYPQRWIGKLGLRAPSVLFFSGNSELLNERSIGIVGSRDVDPAGSEFAFEVSAAAGELGFVVVSGGARGVDQIAMNSALESSHASVGILADSLLRATETAQREGLLDFGLCCLCSPYSPASGFSVGNAMSRNKLIYAGTAATVVVSSSSGSGGTWAGATEALQNSYCPLIVRSQPSMPEGNVRLLEMGAHALRNPEDLEHLLGTLESGQGTLF